MDKAEFISILDKIGAKDDQWLPLERISEIRMKDGSAYYPNIEGIRFRSDRKGKDILVLYGKCERYGAALKGVGFSYDMKKIRLMMVPSDFISQGYVIPKAGDFLRISSGDKIMATIPIISVSAGMNMIVLELSSSIPFSQTELGNFRFSYYSPEKEKPWHYVGSSLAYLNFTPNAIKRKIFKKDYHAKLRCKDIDFISIASA